ncbi:MAG: hypothetical protein IPP60_12205 [Sphingobacteriales bacterium]|nr:hypothetical protein [Sphingobacteriales bacterium]
MPRIFFFIFIIFSVAFKQEAYAQLSKSVEAIEAQHKDCLRIKPDSSGCSKQFLTQVDIILPIVLEQLKAQLFSDEKTALIQDQVSWGKKKGEFFKIQDETFKYNLQEGIWKKDMIRITYQQKAEFILKRIKVLLKRLKE